MPTIDNHLIEKLCKLSKLSFPENELPELKDELNKILNLVEKLNELDTNTVDPLIYLNENKNCFREDVVQGEVSTEEALKNAPSKDSNYIKVPKVISK